MKQASEFLVTAAFSSKNLLKTFGSNFSAPMVGYWFFWLVQLRNGQTCGIPVLLFPPPGEQTKINRLPAFIQHTVCTACTLPPPGEQTKINRPPAFIQHTVCTACTHPPPGEHTDKSPSFIPAVQCVLYTLYRMYSSTP